MSDGTTQSGESPAGTQPGGLDLDGLDSVTDAEGEIADKVRTDGFMLQLW